MLDWPSCVAGEINTLSDRAAMGLPESFVAPLVGPSGHAVAAMVRWPVAQLVAELGNVARPTSMRLDIGVALSILGDTRLEALDPAMVTIPGGVVAIGTAAGAVHALYERYRRFGVKRAWLEKETPRFDTHLASFRIARYPVTNREYVRFLEETGFEQLPTSWIHGQPGLTELNRPVYTVTADAARAYAAWLRDKTGRPFRLPTEYEWEYAAAGPDGREFPWGDDETLAACNTMETGLLSTSPVGMFPASDSVFGIADMAGNVEEFVDTDYHVYPGGALVEDDLFLRLGYYRIARGGAFNRFIDLARCRRRHGAYPKSLYAIGFRIAESV